MQHAGLDSDTVKAMPRALGSAQLLLPQAARLDRVGKRIELLFEIGRDFLVDVGHQVACSEQTKQPNNTYNNNQTTTKQAEAVGRKHMAVHTTVST